MLEFIDRFLQPLSRKNSSSVKETTDFLDKVRKIHNSWENEKTNKPFLVSMDSQSLYPKIDQNECTGAYKMTHQTDSVNA